MNSLVLRATVICGTLDIISAFVFAGVAGRTPADVLQIVAAGPFGNWPITAGPMGAGVGLIVHYTIMAVMVAAFVSVVRHLSWLSANPIWSGLAYGLLLYVIMYWIVLPTRWPELFPQTGTWNVASALFSHLVCVGLPLGLLTARASRPVFTEDA